MRFMWKATIPLATPAPPTMRTSAPKPMPMVPAWSLKNSACCAWLMSGRGGGITRASAKKMTPNAV